MSVTEFVASPGVTADPGAESLQKDGIRGRRCDSSDCLGTDVSLAHEKLLFVFLEDSDLCVLSGDYFQPIIFLSRSKSGVHSSLFFHRRGSVLLGQLCSKTINASRSPVPKGSREPRRRATSCRQLPAWRTTRSRRRLTR